MADDRRSARDTTNALMTASERKKDARVETTTRDAKHGDVLL